VRDRSGLRRAAGGPVTGGAGDRAGRARGAQPRGRSSLLAAAAQRRRCRARRRVRGGGVIRRSPRWRGCLASRWCRSACAAASASLAAASAPPSGRCATRLPAPGAAGGGRRRAGRPLRRRGARQTGARSGSPPGAGGAAAGHLGAAGRAARRQRAGAHPRHLLAIERAGAILATWSDDPWSRGAYSTRAPWWRPEDEELLARPVSRLHFAGEHTAGQWAGLMEGALRSGLRVAGEILAARQSAAGQTG
jgi:hypothetical protein